MKHKIYIAHPNDIVDNAWREVGQAASIEDAMDHLASPTFEWSYGTLARIALGQDSVYSGAYTHTDFVAIEDKIFNLWQTSLNATKILTSLQSKLSERMMARLGCVCIRSSERVGDISPEGEQLLRAIEVWDEKKFFGLRSELAEAANQSLDGNLWQDINSVIFYGFGGEDPNGSVATIPYQLGNLSADPYKIHYQ